MFSGYTRIGDNRYRERYGLDFEDFAPGQIFRHRPGITLSQQDNVDDALDTLNGAQVHYDAHYAAQTTWKNPLMVSTITLQRLIGMSAKTFGKRRAIPGFQEISMTGPVFGGDTLYSESTIAEVAPGPDPDCGTVSVVTRGIKPDGKIVAKIVWRVVVWRRGRHPEDRATPNLVRATEPRFASHRDAGDGAFVEQCGQFFEDCTAGDTFVHYPRKTFRRDEAIEHSYRSLDLTPMGHDLQWVEEHQGGRYCIPETFVVSAVTALTTRSFGRVVANLGWVDTVLPNPVHPGDTVEAESTIVEKRESRSRPNEGILTVDTHARNQRGELVVSYRRNLLVYRRDAQTPYAAAGY
jgi:itaconyl-CoA hydratase